MMYLSCMTTTTSSDFPSFHVCTNCGHEHQAVDLDDIVILDAEGFVRQVMCADDIKDGTSVLCADEDACERRMGRMEPLPDDAEDPGIDPPPAHLDGDPDEEVEDGRWYDYDDGEYEKEYD